MRNRIIILLIACIIISGTYVYTKDNEYLSKNIQTYEVHSEAVEKSSEAVEKNTTDFLKLKNDLITEIDKENVSLIKENKELREEISKLKKEFNYKEDTKAAKFYRYTVYNTFNNRYHSTFNESSWADGTNFKVDGKIYHKGIGFDRVNNGDRSYYVAKLYNEGGVHSNLTGFIGMDDLAKDLSDAEITFKVFNNDNIIKCYNEFYGEELYNTKFNKSDGLQEIDVNLKGANNIIIEFSVDRDSDLNYFLLLDPEFE